MIFRENDTFIFFCQVIFVGGIPFDIKLPAPERIIVRSEDELIAKLDESQKDIEQGRTSPASEVYSKLEAKYGL